MHAAEIRRLLEDTYRAALEQTRPALLTARHLPGTPPDAVLAVGKAAPGMLSAALDAYPGVPALAIVPPGLTLAARSGLKVVVGGHPVPDEGSVQAGQAALRLAAGLGADRHLLVLISGGGSALMSAPWGVTLAQKQALTEALLASGADIGELNTVRKHLSQVKGGRLAAATSARVTSLLLSDVVGDDPATIASGPTVPDASTFAQALGILDRYSLDAPEARRHLERGAAGEVDETPKARRWEKRTSHQVIGSGRLMTRSASAFLTSRGVRAESLGELTGEAREVAAAVAAKIRQLRSAGGGPQVLLWGGETTVTLGQERGLGGRNQEFALALLLALGEKGAHGLLAGSDGQDGNSGAAGAFISPGSLERARRSGLDAARSLARHDSAPFFAALGDQFVTGPSGTNLNDFAAVWLGEEKDG